MIRFLKSVVIYFSFLFLCLPCFSQHEKYASGTILDEEGNTMIGVVVSAKRAGIDRTTATAVSDIDGKFSIRIGQDVKSIVFSALGMQTKEIVLKDDISNLKVVMRYQAKELDQVVITGYSQTTTKKITGSVGVVTSDIIKEKPLNSIDAILQGEIAGVAVNATSGRPGAQSTIRIRGVNNLSGNSSPLWVVDGVPLQNDIPDMTSEQIKTGGFDNIFVNGIGGVNPNDIENVTILKDAAAAAIYGSRAANGVIVVTTKRGKEGRMKVAYSNNFSFSFAPTKNNNRMNSAEKLSWEQEIWDEFSADKYKESLTDNTVFYPVIGIIGQIRSGAGPFDYLKGNVQAQNDYISSLSTVNTNWYDMLFRNSFSMNHHISVSGGSDKSTYYVSAGYTGDDGMLINNNYERFNFTSNITNQPNKYIKLDIGADVSLQKSVMPDSYVDPFQYAYFANPYESAYDVNGNYTADNTYFNLGYYNGNKAEVMPNDGFNIMRELNENNTKTNNWQTVIKGSAEISIFRQLKFVALGSYSFSNNKSNKVTGENTYTAFKDRLGNDKYSNKNLYGSISQNATVRESYVARGHFLYNNSFGQHTISAIAGSELRGSSLNTIFTKRYNYDPKTGNTSLPGISGETDAWLRAVELLNGEYFNTNRYASFYASVDYFYDNKYVFNTSFRTDGSSNFGSKEQFNPTWSAGGAWHISQEEFLKESENISHLTFRAACGFTGDVNSSASPYLIMQYLRQQYRYYDGEQFLMGKIPTAPNPNLGWEKTFDVKASLDLGLWDERATIAVEAYRRMSTDVITSSQVLSTTGFYTQSFNSADIINQGIETTIGGKIIKSKEFTLGASVNVAYNYNKVTKYNPSYANKLTVKDRYVEGYPVGAILAGKERGLDSETGLYKFKLRPDAQINNYTDLNKADNYRYYLGTTIAPITGGFNLSADYKSFRLSIGGSYSLGAKKYDKITSPASYYNPRHEGATTEIVQSQFSDIYASHLNVNREITDRWTESNKSAKYPRLYDYYGTKYNFNFTNVMESNIVDAIYLKDVSYLRIRNILFSYALPKSFLNTIKVENLKLNLSLNNFITITGYDGMDPEVPGATYPTTRSVSFGLSLNL